MGDGILLRDESFFINYQNGLINGDSLVMSEFYEPHVTSSAKRRADALHPKHLVRPRPATTRQLCCKAKQLVTIIGTYETL